MFCSNRLLLPFALTYKVFKNLIGANADLTHLVTTAQQIL